eukprot:2273253-Alexandrium_andersonii.AAC.1
MFAWFLVVFGVPISRKNRWGGTLYSWIGCDISLRQLPPGISASCADEAFQLLDRRLSAQMVGIWELRGASGAAQLRAWRPA